MKARHNIDHLSWELARSPLNTGDPDWEDAIPAQVPGSLLMDLYRAGLVPDPYFGENFRACRWAGEWTFWYRTQFTADQLPSLTADVEHLTLHFETIDTYGEVFLNGHSLGQTSNMFLRYDFDVLPYIDWEGENEVVVRIDPVKAAAKAWLEANPIDPTGVRSLFDDDRPYIRKSQMTFGWDNCPYLVSGGIPRPVWLESRTDASLESLAWDVRDVDATARTARLILSGTVDHPIEHGRINVDARCGEHTFTAQGDVAADGTWRVVAFVEGAKLWWPNDVGDPNLYDVTVELVVDDVTVDQETLQIGLREVRVITEPAETRWVDYRIGMPTGPTEETVMDGADIGPWRRVPLAEPVEVEVRPFRIEVNGRRVFAKGFDWQNPDVLVGNETPEQVRHLVDAAADAHMNMLRVWGGGAVELDAFYQQCSERGLLVWQDFFFACALYPRDDAFLELVRVEAEDIVKRLRNHTSLAMWCGDNESDMILYDRGMDPNDYALNKVVLRGAVASYDVQDRYYHVSSPSGGPYPRSDWGGDKRNWGPRYPHGNYRHIRQESARIVSESGSKSLPSVETVKRSIPQARQWPLNNLTWRLHTGDLDLRIRGDYVRYADCQRFFPAATSLADGVTISQFAGAWGVKLLIERCRQRKGECGGIMVWKNADQWPCLDHGFFDYYGHPRTVYAWSKHAYAPVAVSMTQDFADPLADLEVWLVSDLDSAVSGTITLRALTIDAQGTVLDERELHSGSAQVGSDATRCLLTYPVKGFDPEWTVFRAAFESQDGSAKHQATYTMTPSTAYHYHVLGGHDNPDPGTTV